MNCDELRNSEKIGLWNAHYSVFEMLIDENRIDELVEVWLNFPDSFFFESGDFEREIVFHIV